MAKLLEFIKSYDDLRQSAENKAGGEPPDPKETTRPDDDVVADKAPPAVLVPVAPPSPASPATAPSPVAAPSPAASSSATTSPGPAEAAAEAEDLYRRAVLAISRLFEAAVMEKLTPGRLLATVAELEEISPEIVRSTAQGRDLLRKAMGTYTEGEGFILPHSANVAILAVHLGRELDLAESGLPQLCLAGFVHDVGSVQLPSGLLTKSDSLTPSEWEQMRSRPTRSYEMLHALGGRYERVAEIARQVYERLDGSGYPRGLQGDEILPEARIVGTVDFFESFAHPRPYKATVPGSANHGIQMLMQMAEKFGSATLKALVGSIGLFPIGSYVRLSGGEVGRVVDVKRENPMRPEVEILLTNERQPPREARTMDLLSIPHIYVARALTASDLRELGLLPSPSEMPPLSGREDSRS